MVWLENRNQAYQFTCTKSVAPMPERPPKRNLIPLGIVFWSAILPLKKILVKVAQTVHELYKDSAVGPNQYHLLNTHDCCCLSYRMFGLLFKSMSFPAKRKMNILFHNIITTFTGLSKNTRTVWSPRHNHKHIVLPCFLSLHALPCRNNNVPLLPGSILNTHQHYHLALHKHLI